MMIKVTKYTQGHLYPTASFTWVERWRNGEVPERRRQKGRMEGQWVGHRRDRRRKVKRGLMGRGEKKTKGKDESEEGATRNVWKEGRGKGRD